MPPDPRLVGAVRELTSHAARHALLAQDAVSSVTEAVARAVATSVAATNVADSSIEVRFDGDEELLRVTISSEAEPAGPTPDSLSANGLSVDWSREGARQSCCIQQRNFFS